MDAVAFEWVTVELPGGKAVLPELGLIFFNVVVPKVPGPCAGAEALVCLVAAEWDAGLCWIGVVALTQDGLGRRSSFNELASERGRSACLASPQTCAKSQQYVTGQILPGGHEHVRLNRTGFSSHAFPSSSSVS
jgi:hypothetical protein